MSEALDQLIERVVNDKEFRKLLFKDMDKALEGYALSDEERNLLENLDEETFEEFAGGIGSRTTKGFMPGTG